MPHHPKNRLKLTGDTRLPDIGDLLPAEEIEVIAVEVDSPPRVYADGWVPSEVEVFNEPEPPSRVAALERKLGRAEARAPWLAIGAALAFGWLVARMLRR